MLRAKIAPSMMCADFLNLRNVLAELEAAGADFLHIDVMDGEFVPNFMLSEGIASSFRTAACIPLDYHLMIGRPERKTELFDIREGDLVTLHCESTPHLSRAIAAYRERGARVGVALNPATPLSALDYVADSIDAVLVMTVNPGFAGQKLVCGMLEKIRDAREYLNKRGRQEVLLEVDGNVSLEHAAAMRRAGADTFVAGTSSVFQRGKTIREGFTALSAKIAEGEREEIG